MPEEIKPTFKNAGVKFKIMMMPLKEKEKAIKRLFKFCGVKPCKK